MPGGRPTKYDCDKDGVFQYEGYTVEQTRKYLESFADDSQVIPSIAGLAVYLERGRNTIQAWRNEEGKEEFSSTLDKLDAMQELLLLNNGLNGEFNSNITKLALSNHGYAEKTDSNINAKIHDFTHMSDDDLKAELEDGEV